MEKTMIIMIPSQKAGTDMPRYVSPLMILSASLFLWVPAIRPNGMAMTRERTREAPMSPAVQGSFSRIWSSTGRLLLMEIPRFPLAAFPAQLIYCSTTFPLRPRDSLIRSSSSSVIL